MSTFNAKWHFTPKKVDVCTDDCFRQTNNQLSAVILQKQSVCESTRLTQHMVYERMSSGYLEFPSGATASYKFGGSLRQNLSTGDNTASRGGNKGRWRLETIAVEAPVISLLPEEFFRSAVFRSKTVSRKCCGWTTRSRQIDHSKFREFLFNQLTPTSNGVLLSKTVDLLHAVHVGLYKKEREIGFLRSDKLWCFPRLSALVGPLYFSLYAQRRCFQVSLSINLSCAQNRRLIVAVKNLLCHLCGFICVPVKARTRMRSKIVFFDPS